VAGATAWMGRAHQVLRRGHHTCGGGRRYAPRHRPPAASRARVARRGEARADALAQYGAVYEDGDTNAEAMGALERLYREMGRFEELLKVYEKQARDPRRRRRAQADLVRHRGAVREGDQGRREGDHVDVRAGARGRAADAQARWRRSIALSRPGALGGVRRGPAQTHRARRQRGGSDRPQVRLGDTLEKHLGDAAGALENYREILLIEPANEPARAALEALLENPAARGSRRDPAGDLRRSRGLGEAHRALEILASVETSTEGQVTLLRKAARVSAENLNELPRAFDAQARALKDPTHTETRTELEALAAQANSWDRLDAISARSRTRSPTPTLAREYWMRLGAIDERLGKIDEAAGRYAHVLAVDPADSTRRSPRSTRSIGARSAGTISSASSAAASSSPPTAASARRSTGRWREVYERSSASPRTPSRPTARCSPRPREPRRARRIGRALHAPEPCGTSSPRTSTRSSLSRTTEEQQTLLMLRLAALRERDEPRRDAIDVYRQVLERDPENAEALAALERLGQSAEHELAIAEILEPLYRQSGDFQKLIGVHEVQVRRTDDPRVASSCCTRSRRSTRTRAAISRRHSTRTRGRSPSIRARRRRKALDRLARATGRFADLAKVYESWPPRRRSPRSRAALFTMSARVYEATSAMRTARSRTTAACSRSTPRTSARPSPSSASSAGPSATRAVARSSQQKADILEEPTEKKQALFQAASIEEDVLEKPETPSPSTVACSSSTPRISAPSTR
jgi:tetratricopeptide (TPR) repeat protein